MKVPETPRQIRDWVKRLGLSMEAAAIALGLGNTDTIMREYCREEFTPGKERTPSKSTRFHMDLIEQAFLARAALRVGNAAAALKILDTAFSARLDRNNARMLPRIEPKPGDQNGSLQHQGPRRLQCVTSYEGEEHGREGSGAGGGRANGAQSSGPDAHDEQGTDARQDVVADGGACGPVESQPARESDV